MSLGEECTKINECAVTSAGEQLLELEFSPEHEVLRCSSRRGENALTEKLLAQNFS